MSSTVNLSEVVLEYRRGRACYDAEDSWWRADGVPLAEAVERAALSKLKDGTLHSHQRRLPASARLEAARELKAVCDIIEKCADFYSLHSLVRAVLSDVWGIGALTIYDISDRIAHHRGLAPDRIYLHAGTRDGARALLPDLDPKANEIAISDLPEPLRVLTCREAEDVLCIFKDAFRGRKMIGACGYASHMPKSGRIGC